MPGNIGIFGGTFDPPHLGHLILAAEAHEQLGLDRLLWILTPAPPHKREQVLTSIAHRLAMTRLALADYPQFELSQVEISRPGPHYTLETVQMVKGQFPDKGIILLMGGDSLRDLPTWYKPSELLAECEGFGVMRRPDDSFDIPEIEKTVPDLTRKVKYIDAPLLEISSRDIRQRVKEGRSFKHYLIPSVYRYITDNSLYK